MIISSNECEALTRRVSDLELELARRTLDDEVQRAALEAAEAGIWIWNCKTDEIIWSDACKALFGLPRGATITYPVFRDAIHPDDRERTDREISLACANRAGFDIEHRAVWPDGSVHWLRKKGRVFCDPAGEIECFQGIVVDLGERRLNEMARQERDARRSYILDSALDCIVTIDQNGRLVEFNPAAESTFGYRREDAIGRSMAELIIPERFRAAHYRGLAKYLKSGEGAWVGRRVDLVALHSDGSEFPVELAIARLPGEGPPMFTAIVREITARLQAEESVELAKEAAEVASRAKSQFLATMSHELCTLLKAITGCSEILSEQAGDLGLDELIPDLQKVGSAGRHLVGLIDALDVSMEEDVRIDRISRSRSCLHAGWDRQPDRQPGRAAVEEK